MRSAIGLEACGAEPNRRTFDAEKEQGTGAWIMEESVPLALEWNTGNPPA